MGSSVLADALLTGRTRPPRSLNVVHNPPPEEVGARVDWSSWYLTDEEDMGQSNEQALIIGELLSGLRVLARERGWERVFINGDQFFAWVPEEPLVRVSPDVYLLDDPPDPVPASWQTWQPGHRPPRFAVEIVSGEDRRARTWRKDYDEAPAKYAQLGTRELLIFDPEAAAERSRRRERIALQLYRREADDSFVRVHSGAEPVYSVELQIWVCFERDGEDVRLRLARDEALTDLVPTEAELAEQERRRAEQERQLKEKECRLKNEARKRARAADKRAEQERRLREEARRSVEQERRRAEQERQRAEAAERELAALRAHLAHRAGQE